MSKTKTMLLARKAELEEQLKPYAALKEELSEVNKALRALEPAEPTCRGCSSGCDVCRTGPYYR